MILEKLIKSIKEGELTNPHLIATLLEGEQRLIMSALDVAYANGRVDALKGDLKSPYSEWKYGQNNDTEYFKFTKLKVIFAPMDTHEAMQDLFATYTNSQLQEMTAENYYTIASWRFKFNCNQLSMEKQISILTKLNYQPTQNLLWKKQAK
jgi:hypothetical protein